MVHLLCLYIKFALVILTVDLTTTVFSDCSTGQVRLADLVLNGSTAQGRVEVCINQAWGTVCNTRFDEEDAGTVCVVAGGYFRNGALLGDYQLLANSISYLSQNSFLSDFYSDGWARSYLFGTAGLYTSRYRSPQL